MAQFHLDRGGAIWNLTSYARRGPGQRDRLSATELALIARTVRHTPEVMVKVTGGGGANTSHGVNAHFNYIGRRGDLEIETDDGERLSGRGVGKHLIQDWDLNLDEDRERPDLFATNRRVAPKLVHKLIFSMPAGTPPQYPTIRTVRFSRGGDALDEFYPAILTTMLRSIQPLQFLLTLLAGWVNRRQLEAIEYLKEENRLLKERLGGRRLRFTDAERRRLARRAHALRRKALSELDTLVTPDTLMRWYLTLVAQKWTYTDRRGPGRPRTIQVIVKLIISMALENRSWGYTRIQGALANLGHNVGRGTIANVLHEHGIDPAPQRGKYTSWSTFLKAHWDSIAATDFFTVEVLTLRGFVTYYILFVLDLASRTVKIAGITSHPNEVWMVQMARNLTDTGEPFLRRTRFLIMDRDTKYSAAFRAVLARERIEPIRLPPRSPNLNAYAERFVRSVRTECTGRIVFFSRSSLERALTQYVAHYHEERNHQGLNNRLLKDSNRPIHRGGRVERRERLGGMLNFYYREAA